MKLITRTPAKNEFGATRVRPHFFPELVGLEAKTNAERRAEYERKLNHIEEIAA